MIVENIENKSDELYKIFQAMGYTWWTGAPTRDEIKDCIEGLAKHLDDDCDMCATGRIVVRRECIDEEECRVVVYLDINPDHSDQWDPEENS